MLSNWIKSVSPPLAVLTMVLALLLFPTRVQAQCLVMSDLGTTVGSTNFNTAKSQMWFNDGLWWGVFTDDTVGIHFYSFPNNSATKGAIIDAGIAGLPDVLWDDTNLFIMVWKSVGLATLYKFTYDSTTKTYSLVSGFPVSIPLNLSSSAALVIQKDSTGKLWATYTSTQGGLSDGTVRVIWSTSTDHLTWNTTGATLETGLTPNVPEISTISHFGGNKIGVTWSNRPGREIGFRYHIDGDPETTWSSKEVVDSGLGPQGLGPVSNDHLSIQSAPDGRLFLAAKDSDSTTPFDQNKRRIWLYVRSAAGVWGSKTIIEPDLSRGPTRPVLVLDVTHSIVYVIYHDSSPAGAGRIFIARSPMNNPSFYRCLFSVVSAGNPTSTKQNVTSTTGMMAAASTGDTGSGEIVFRLVALTPIRPGIKGDVSGRPNGSGMITVSDWVQMGRFIGGLDTPDPSEFQRADINGDGILSIADWVRCGRIAVGLDPVTQ